MEPGRTKTRMIFVLLGIVVAFVLMPYYGGPLHAVVDSYGSNLVVSFVVYFLAAIAVSSIFRTSREWVVATLLALCAVEGFEVTNGFGVMTNVYDTVDLAVNALGIGLAVAADLAIQRRTADGAAGR